MGGARLPHGTFFRARTVGMFAFCAGVLNSKRRVDIPFQPESCAKFFFGPLGRLQPGGRGCMPRLPWCWSHDSTGAAAGLKRTYTNHIEEEQLGSRLTIRPNISNNTLVVRAPQLCIYSLSVYTRHTLILFIHGGGSEWPLGYSLPPPPRGSVRTNVAVCPRGLHSRPYGARLEPGRGAPHGAGNITCC